MDCIISIIEENPESKESGLAHLCEFIEDCEHTVLATKILHLLGKEGPRTPSPSKYIRFIFNRVVLENEAVRAGKLHSATLDWLHVCKVGVWSKVLAWEGMGALKKQSIAVSQYACSGIGFILLFALSLLASC